MPFSLFLWNDDPNGNVPHLAEHGVAIDEAEYVVQNPIGHASNRDGDPIAFGRTAHGRHLAVSYWFVDEQRTTVYVETAYDVPPRTGRPSNRPPGVDPEADPRS